MDGALDRESSGKLQVLKRSVASDGRDLPPSVFLGMQSEIDAIDNAGLGMGLRRLLCAQWC